jgi:hypothetical protein
VVDEQLLHRMLSKFARTLVQHYAVADVRYELSDRLLAVVGVEGAGVSLADNNGRMRFATAINEAGAGMEQAQEQSQRGRCVDAFRNGEVTMVLRTSPPSAIAGRSSRDRPQPRLSFDRGDPDAPRRQPHGRHQP